MCRRQSMAAMRRLRDARWLFHAVAALYFARVWVWHVSSESIHRQGRQNYGGYFCYLTFCSFTVQVAQLMIVTWVDLIPKGYHWRPKRIADDLSCSVFVLANCVTLLYYIIEFLTPGGIISRAHEIVQWIDRTTHVLNSVVAWIDILICHPRRFGARSYGLTALFASCYGCWIAVIKWKSGKFPYRFLDNLPHPQGLLFMVVVNAVLMSLIFFLGRYVSRLTKRHTYIHHSKELDTDSSTRSNGTISFQTKQTNGLKRD